MLESSAAGRARPFKGEPSCRPPSASRERRRAAPGGQRSRAAQARAGAQHGAHIQRASALGARAGGAIAVLILACLVASSAAADPELALESPGSGVATVGVSPVPVFGDSLIMTFEAWIYLAAPPVDVDGFEFRPFGASGVVDSIWNYQLFTVFDAASNAFRVFLDVAGRFGHAHLDYVGASLTGRGWPLNTWVHVVGRARPGPGTSCTPRPG
eukprot:tig00020563_g11309.t1